MKQTKLGIKLGSNLLFENNFTNLCSKAIENLHAPAADASYIHLEK